MAKRTDFGDLLWEKRDSLGITMMQMAETLYVSASVLSLIELGRSEIRSYLCKRLVSRYFIEPDERLRMADALAKSANKVDIDLTGLGYEHRKVSVDLALNIDNISTAGVEKLQAILDEYRV